MRFSFAFVWVSCLFLLCSAGLAYEDRFFSVKESGGLYEVLPGDTFCVSFSVANRDLVSPRNVTAFLEPCPLGWDCERKVLSFSDDGVFDVNLSVVLPETAIPKRYTLYVMLESESDTRRSSADRVLVTVLSEEQADTLTYEEYLAKQGEADSEDNVPESLAGQDTEPAILQDAVQEPKPKPSQEPVDVTEEPVEAGPEPPSTPDEQAAPGGEVNFGQANRSDLIANVERLESNRHFVEYASVVLIVVLVFVAVGAFVAYRKEK